MFAVPCPRTPLSHTLTVLAMAIAVTTHAGEPAPTPAEAAIAPAPATLGWTACVGYESQYVFRGFNYGDNLCEVGLSMPFKLNDAWTFTFAPWYGELAGGHYSELDLVASLAWKTKIGTLSAGFAWYDIPSHGWSTIEPNLTFKSELGQVAGAPIFFTAATFLDVYADGGGYSPPRYGDPGWFFESSLSSSLKVTDKLSLAPEVRCSYGTGYYGVSGWNDLTLKLTATYALSRRVSLAPFIAKSFALDGLRNAGETDHLAGGVMMNIDF